MRSLVPWAVALVLVALGVFLWNREHRRADTAERRAEASELARKGQIVEQPQTPGQLDRTVASLTAENADLKAALAEARKAAPDARPSSASRLSTGPLVVQRAKDLVPKPSDASPASDVHRDPETLHDASIPPCILTEADQVSVDALVVELATEKANTVVVGSATVYKEGTPRQAIAFGAFRSSLSDTHQLEQAAPPRWGAMALGACGKGGCGPGAAVLFPSANVLGMRLEGLAGAVASPGEFLVIGGVGGRW